MTLTKFSNFQPRFLSESDYEDLVGDFGDLGLVEKRWTWSQIESAWHRIEWGEIIEFYLFKSQTFVTELQNTSEKNSNLIVKLKDPFSFFFKEGKLEGEMTSILNSIKSSKGTENKGSTYSIQQISNVLIKGVKGYGPFSIPQIFSHLYQKLKEDEDLPNLWVDFDLSFLPQKDLGVGVFEIKLMNVRLKPNWDEVADLMCEPAMLKELKIYLDYEI